jgi:hypothetical protein
VGPYLARFSRDVGATKRLTHMCQHKRAPKLIVRLFAGSIRNRYDWSLGRSAFVKSTPRVAVVVKCALAMGVAINQASAENVKWPTNVPPMMAAENVSVGHPPKEYQVLVSSPILLAVSVGRDHSVAVGPKYDDAAARAIGSIWSSFGSSAITTGGLLGRILKIRVFVGADKYHSEFHAKPDGGSLPPVIEAELNPKVVIGYLWITQNQLHLSPFGFCGCHRLIDRRDGGSMCISFSNLSLKQQLLGDVGSYARGISGLLSGFGLALNFPISPTHEAALIGSYESVKDGGNTSISRPIGGPMLRRQKELLFPVGLLAVGSFSLFFPPLD